MEAISIKSAYEALQTHAVWANLSHLEIYEVSGSEWVSFLNNYNTQDIQGLKHDHAALGAFLTQKGKIVSDSLIIKLEKKCWLVLEPGYGKKILEHLKIFLSISEVEFKDISQNWAHLALFGPAGTNILKDVLEIELDEQDMVVQTLSHQEDPSIAFRTDRLGAPAWEIFLTPKDSETLKEALSNKEVPLLDANFMEALRVEAGFPKMGIDIKEDNLVAEVGLDERATSFNKGCYLGQEPTARINTQGHVNKKVMQFKLKRSYEGSLPLEIYQGEKKIGTLTSTAYSQKLKVPLGLGLLTVKALEKSEPITVKGPQEEIEIEAVSKQ